MSLPMNPEDMSHDDGVYMTHNFRTGQALLLVSPTQLQNIAGMPGWYGITIGTEPTLNKFAAQCMNKADELADLRKRGELPQLDE